MYGLKFAYGPSPGRPSSRGYPARAAIECTATSSRTMVGYGPCMRCVEEGRYDRCYGFEGAEGGLVCQKCSHSWQDHS